MLWVPGTGSGTRFRWVPTGSALPGTGSRFRWVPIGSGVAKVVPGTGSRFPAFRRFQEPEILLLSTRVVCGEKKCALCSHSVSFF